MDTSKWNITEIIINLLKSDFNISYTDIARGLGCTEQTLLDWRKGIRTPKKYNIDTICEKLPLLLRSASDRQHYVSLLKHSFNNAGDKVQISMEKYDSIEGILKYIYTDFEKELGKDKLFSLINSSYSIPLLRKTLLKKIQINEHFTPIFQVEEFDEKEKNEFQSKEMKWKLNLDHCFILKFRGHEKKFTYKVLIDFNYNETEHILAGNYVESRNAAEGYDVNMILLFGNIKISDEELRFFMDSNIYMEEIKLKEINAKDRSKDYIYNSPNTDIEMELLANKYTDILLGRLRKYFSVIYKNILFDSEKILNNKQKENYTFWDARFATRHHINFQENRIKELFECGKIPQNGYAMAIGYLSFPCILRLVDMCKKVYLIDNSNKSVKMYQEYIKNLDPARSKKLVFITFTSGMFIPITKLYNLYYSMDFILLGSGSGSFIKKLQTYYLICNSWLKKNGVLYISFLNEEFLYQYVDRATAEQNFEFIPHDNEKRATAFITNSVEKYDLYCETYNCNEIMNVARKYFELITMYSYPLASVLIGTHKSKLQNILKELDKEYSKQGWQVKTFSNCKGYYIDAVLKKADGCQLSAMEENSEKTKKILFHDKEKFRKYYLKTLLLAEKTTSVDDCIKNDTSVKIYTVLLSTKKRLPETDNNEICLGDKKFRLLNISEINALGIEYRNISPFLKSSDTKITLIKNYDIELTEKENRIFYLGDGSTDGGYEIEQRTLISLLTKYAYKGIKITSTPLEQL